ncbi:Uncharacterized protein FWK35_00015911 [Aphis craccivora]|uniref:Uncharacterized protein n=1 Tax=Aphis craccivora TaxID=307492 RepID=A0A6G0Y6M8_APHCR|nr:Uncharacterized protein FWK35_00015911 [Aphis craccivora]
MLKYSVSRVIAMNVFGESQADIQSSNKTIQNDLNNQQKEIDIIKSNIVHLQSLENRMSELFNNYIETETKLSFILSTIDSVNVEIKRITGIFDENSLPNLGSYISDLNSLMNVFGSSQAGETKKTISKLDDFLKIIKFELNEKILTLENNTKTQGGVIEVVTSSQAGETKKTISKLDDSLKIIKFELNENNTKTQGGVIEVVTSKIQVIEQKLSSIEQLTENLKFKVSDLEDTVDYMKSQISDLVENDAENVAEIKKP